MLIILCPSPKEHFFLANQWIKKDYKFLEMNENAKTTNTYVIQPKKH